MYVISTKFFLSAVTIVTQIAKFGLHIPSCNTIKKILVFGLLLVCTTFAEKSIPTKPSNSFVYDENHLMSAQEIHLFNTLAEELHNKTGIDIACVLMNDIGKDGFQQFAAQTTKEWNLGGENQESILILVSQKQRKRSIETGSGVKEYLNDATIYKTQQKTLAPAFRQQKYGEGILAFAWNLAQISAQEKGATIDLDGSQFITEEKSVPARTILFIMLVAFLLLMSKFSGGRGNGCLWFLFGNVLESKKESSRSGFGGGFGRGKGGFGGGFGRGNPDL